LQHVPSLVVEAPPIRDHVSVCYATFYLSLTKVPLMMS
jgi:hypothetical protein